MRDAPFFSGMSLRDGLHPRRYPLTIPAVRDLHKLRFHPAVTVLAGENGAGKSTLLEAIAVRAGFPIEGGTKSFRTRPEPDDTPLADHLILGRNSLREEGGFFLRAESGYVLMTQMNELGVEGSYGGNLHERSHGEAFMDIFTERFRTAHDCLFLLDEIESALSPQRQLEFLALMHLHVERGSSFVVSTHSPILMSYPRSRLYWLSEDGIEERDWRETEHVAILKGFLGRPEAIHRTLFGGDL